MANKMGIPRRFMLEIEVEGNTYADVLMALGSIMGDLGQQRPDKNLSGEGFTPDVEHSYCLWVNDKATPGNYLKQYDELMALREKYVGKKIRIKREFLSKIRALSPDAPWNPIDDDVYTISQAWLTSVSAENNRTGRGLGPSWKDIIMIDEQEADDDE